MKHILQKESLRRGQPLYKGQKQICQSVLFGGSTVFIYVCKVDYRLLSVTCHAKYKSFGLLNWHSFFIDTCACVISSQKV